LGISRARKERTEASPLDDHRRLTLVALLVCGLRLRRLVAVGLRRLAFGITGARIELAEPPPPEHHRLTAVLALLLGFLLDAWCVISGGQRFFEWIVQLLDDGRPWPLAGGDVIELALHPRRESDVDDPRESRGHHV